MVGAILAALLLGVLIGWHAVYAIVLVGVALLAVLTVTWPTLAVFGLLLWVPLDGWALKFVPGGSLLLVIPDAVSMLLLLLALQQMALRLRARSNRSPAMSWLLVPAVVIATAAFASWLVNGNPTLEALYWIRVNLRFVPLALWGFLYPDFRSLAKIATVSLYIQASVGLAELLGGKGVASFFWPGRFTIGSIATQADTLAGVGNKVVAGTVGHYNQFGLLLVLYLSVMVGALFLPQDLLSNGWRRAMRLGVPIGLAAVLVSQSRQAIAVMILLAGILVLSRARHATGRRIGAVALASLVLSVGTLRDFLARRSTVYLRSQIRSSGRVRWLSVVDT